ncbi:hypothetical protein TWF481_000201 [Arthrobotrys musiformis]|uniref:Amidohydrolase-related domain-containing protein n=1 Tax=Arthrobotrys musiformis TaxID=47236 RepID=A0AAV9WP45_9PEZI
MATLVQPFRLRQQTLKLLRIGTSKGRSSYRTVAGSEAQYKLPIPAGSWDSHVHVVGDETKYPLHPSHPYRPKPASLASLQSFNANLHPNITHPVIVSLSVYANDNRCLLDALSDLQTQGAVARGVVGIDPLTISDSELSQMHELGVRGVRLNLKSSLVELSKSEFEKTLYRYADRLKPLKTWALQIHLSLPQVALISDIIPKLGVTTIIDHLAVPSTKQPAKEQEGYKNFMRLLSRGEVYTKLSGMDRFPILPLLDEYATEVVSLAPDRIVWASDWPHTGGVGMNPGGDRNKIQDFRAVDDVGMLGKAVEVYCKGDEGVVRKIWRDNARELWDYHGDN